MSRTILALFAGFATLVGGMSAIAADTPGSGTWKLTFPIQGRSITFLMMFSETDGKWVGDFLGSSLALRAEPTLEDVTIKDDVVRFKVILGGQPLSFDGRLAKDGKKVSGSFSIGGDLQLVDMLPSKLKNLNDKYALSKELLGQVEGGNEFFSATYEVLRQATQKKEKAADVRALADRASKVASPYGPRWERDVALKLADILAAQPDFVDVAVEQARLAERMLDPREDASTQMQVLESLAGVLRKTNKLDEVKAIDGRLSKLEARDFAEYSKKFPPFKPLEFKGRKGKSDRAVMIELFTGAECPPCVAVDLAFDGIDQSFGPKDVVLLQYHMHIPGPDPLTSRDGMTRAEYYGGKIEGTPTIFFNGKLVPGGGGGAAASKVKYQAFRETIEDLLEAEATAKLQLTAERKGNEVTLKANVSELATPGENITLRFAITEERVRYTGGNGLRYHHHVVRALPGGAKGFPMPKAMGTAEAKVDLTKLRSDLSAYLDDYAKELAKEDESFPRPDRPMDLKHLYAVAFLQNDKTQEVLQVVQITLEEKE